MKNFFVPVIAAYLILLLGLTSVNSSITEVKPPLPPILVKSTYVDTFTYVEDAKITTEIPIEEAQALYIEKWASLAQQQQKKWNIPASITLAQGLLESSAGKSPLAQQNNNHFGIKCFSSNCKKGHCSNFTDDSHKDFFRIFKSVEESFDAHAQVLQKDRYQKAFKCQNVECWATALKEAGYATDPAYATKLMRIIKRHKLEKYD